ncbi:MAG: LysR family transcriptional regulator [Acidaminococcus intestini]|uniref:LysR family transcriptional regulator n=1 Tax=Acidaminococcus intestini TaxID=187327 RepID=A0A943EIJ5_9FIRM|nr:LysR family transcriptional regulator [Acidaminococcus intestini]
MNNLNLVSLYYFVVLADELHMTHAAQKLYITQQNLTQHLQKLEKHYGVKLFERKPKLALTYAGEELYHSAIKILNEENSIINKFSTISKKGVGRLRIAIPSYRANIFLPHVLPKFYQKWPHVRIEFVDKSSDKAEEMLFNNQLDLFIAVKNNNDPSLNITTLLEDKIYLVATNELINKYTAISYSDIKSFELNGTSIGPFKQMPLLLQKGTGRLRRTIDNYFKETGISPQIFLEATTSETLLALLPYNYGGIILTEMRLSELKKLLITPHCFPLLSNGKLLQHRLVLAYHKDYDLPPFAQTFIDLLKDAVTIVLQESHSLC